MNQGEKKEKQRVRSNERELVILCVDCTSFLITLTRSEVIFCWEIYSSGKHQILFPPSPPLPSFLFMSLLLSVLSFLFLCLLYTVSSKHTFWVPSRCLPFPYLYIRFNLYLFPTMKTHTAKKLLGISTWMLNIYLSSICLKPDLSSLSNLYHLSKSETKHHR